MRGFGEVRHGRVRGQEGESEWDGRWKVRIDTRKAAQQPFYKRACRRGRAAWVESATCSAPKSKA